MPVVFEKGAYCKKNVEYIYLLALYGSLQYLHNFGAMLSPASSTISKLSKSWLNCPSSNVVEKESLASSTEVDWDSSNETVVEIGEGLLPFQVARNNVEGFGLLWFKLSWPNFLLVFYILPSFFSLIFHLARRQISQEQGSSGVSFDEAFFIDTCFASSSQKMCGQETEIPFSIL